MSKLPSVTIINSNSMRGVIAPADVISKKVLEDMVDFFELSSPTARQETDEQIAVADNDKSWMSMDAVRKLSRQSD